MHPIVCGDLGVERGGHHRALADGDDPTGGRTARDAWRGPRRSLPTFSTHGARMKSGVKRRVERREVDVGLERVDLPAERVAADHDVEAAERLLAVGAALDSVGEHDHARAGAQRRHAVAHALAQRVEQVERAGELVHRRRLPARQDDRVDGVQLCTVGVPGRPSRRRARSIRRCSRTSPCSANTPIVGDSAD